MKTVMFCIVLAIAGVASPAQAADTIVASVDTVRTNGVAPPAAAVVNGGLYAPSNSAAVAPAPAPDRMQRAIGLFAAVPEPALWAMMIAGMGMVGGLLRRRLRQSEARFTAELRAIAEGD